MIKSINFIIIFLTLVVVSCDSKVTNDKLYGTWKITDVKIEIDGQKTFDVLKKNAEIISLATSYTINSDKTFSKIVSKNEVEEIGFKYEGLWELSQIKGINIINFKVEKVFFDKIGEWEELIKSEMNDLMFDSFELKINKVTSKKMKVIARGNGATIYYTLTQI